MTSDINPVPSPDHSSRQAIAEQASPALWLVVVLSAMAGGMGWGIRGQYGHETGAMIAGVLVGCVLVLMLCRGATSLFVARAVAMCALGISIGGSMTYGQTLGLTQDADLIGNFAALQWGLLGTFVKGAIWIGFAAAFFALALSETRYRPLELALLLLVMLFLLFAGVQLFNAPFDPAAKELPKIYFSDDWRWEPGAALQPRAERWGGLLLALAGLYLYAGWIRGDRLVRRLTLWGVVGGGLGFATGQCVQSFHAWNVDMFRESWFAPWEPHINWWNMMETTFGAVWGAIVGTGLWMNRHLIGKDQQEEPPEITLPAEWLLIAVHVAALVAWNFGSFRQLDWFADLAITMVIIPVIAVSAGRLWPYLLTLPIVTLPIAGKTLRQLCYEQKQLDVEVGWIVYVAAPLLLMTVAALLLARGATKPGSGSTFSRWSLLLMTWTLFTLNFAFFEFPWPWEAWTTRTPNAIIFSICTIGLTAAALFIAPTSPSTDKSELKPDATIDT